MLRGLLIVLGGCAAVLLACTVRPAAAAPSPRLRAQETRARTVLAQVNAIDRRLGLVVEAWDGANYRLGRLRAEVAQSRAELAFARGQQRLAQKQAAQLAVALYSSPTPSSLDTVVGVSSLSDLLGAFEATQAVSGAQGTIVRQLVTARKRAVADARRVEAAKGRQARVVATLTARRAEIEGALAERRRLLSSIREQIVKIKRQEAARQARLAAEARARLAAEAAARRRAELAARQRSQVERADTNQPPTPFTPAPDGTTTTSPLPPPIAPAVPATGAGHPEAASIALRYLGVPYVWGGASPAGFDCSGLVMYVYAQLGISLPHYAAAQYQYGVPVARDQLQPGDLVFFEGLGHVGIYIGNDEIVHAPHTGTVVSIASLSDPWFQATYVGARRI